ncbi:lipoprotein [Altererythrobacter arenosus]|uniref:Lipoprotein n=1 Tax=Altererythrobacter arenosus TaxID=3032592 RepID=A0ABY8FSE8_9SPHN|nr:lipoprotein [Altererythrobacter sp. CAU 1644]WFL77938.1 lipoprotein [Altererythrobacter sp. CAU 1644]
MRKAAILLIALAIAACGQRTDLEPKAGQSLPPAPYGAETPPDAEELLKLEALAAPERSVELRRRSEERADDPFDLPPE